MKENHLQIFRMMERIREKHPSFYYGMRKRCDDKMRNGMIFLTDKNGDYINVPLSTRNNNTNKTRTVGLVFDFKHGRVYIQVVYDAEASASEIAVYKNLAKRFPNVRTRRYKSKTEYEIIVPTWNSDFSHWIDAAEEFMDANIDVILTILTEGSTGMVYDAEGFSKMIRKHIEVGTISLLNQTK